MKRTVAPARYRGCLTTPGGTVNSDRDGIRGGWATPGDDQSDAESAVEATGEFTIDYAPPAWYTQNASAGSAQASQAPVPGVPAAPAPPGPQGPPLPPGPPVAQVPRCRPRRCRRPPGRRRSYRLTRGCRGR
nr:SCO5717 family growth-regulating ATPase [Streptomyces sp. RPA4-2]